MLLAAPVQLIDRILAVVNGEPITLSDVTAAATLGLVSAPAGDDRNQAVLNALIDRRLQLFEVNRYVPPEPTEAAIDVRLAEVGSRFESDAAFDAALVETGVTLPQLRARLRDNLRIESYVQQRFGAAFQPGEDEITRYYRSHEDEFTRGGVLRPYAEVRSEARARVIQERTGSLVRDWTACRGDRAAGHRTVAYRSL
jgi:peptidyl-prolyl cis-trans isomerase SurA